ncbi:LemA family protein [Methylophilaceae bacterium]|nr:LemA family protein [Methylophilaceae bacterium]
MELLQKVYELKSNFTSYTERMQSIFEKIIYETNISEKYEKELLKDVTKLRENINPNFYENKSEMNNILLKMENYPNVNAIKIRNDFQHQISEIEQAVQKSTESYNFAVKNYNSFILSFPASIFCKVFNRKKEKFISNI